MAISATNEALVEAYSSRFLETFHRASVFLNGANTLYEAAMQNAESIRVPKDDTSNYLSAISQSATFTFPSPSDNDVSTVLVEWANPFMARRFVRVDHEAELAPSLVIQNAEQMAIAYARKIDDVVEGELSGLTIPTARVTTAGGANNYVAKADGKNKGSSADTAIVWDALLTTQLKMEQNNLSGLAALRDRGFDVFMPPHIRVNLERYLFNLGVDTITNNIIGGQSYTSVRGFRLWSSNAIDEVNPSGNNNNYFPCYVLNNAALTFGRRFTHRKIWEPGSFLYDGNQYGYMLDFVVQTFTKTVVPDLVYEIRVQSEA